MNERGPNADAVEAYLSLPGAFEALADDARRRLRRGGLSTRRVRVDVNGSDPDDAVQTTVRRSLASQTPFDGDVGVLLRLNLERAILDAGRAAQRTWTVKAGARAGAALRKHLAAGLGRTAPATPADDQPAPVPAWVSLHSDPAPTEKPIPLHALDELLPWPARGSEIFSRSDATRGEEAIRMLKDLVQNPWATAANIDILVRATEPDYTATLAAGGVIPPHCYVGEGADRRYRLTALAAILVANELAAWADELAPIAGRAEALAAVAAASDYLLSPRMLSLLLAKQLRGETPAIELKLTSDKRQRTKIRALQQADRIILDLLKHVTVTK